MLINSGSKEMHSNTDYINNAVVKTLNELACHCSISKFRGAFNTLDDDNKQHYISTITLTQHATAMVRILNAMENQVVSTFRGLLKKNQDFAFSVLRTTSNRKLDLFKTLFNELNSQQKEEYAKYVAKNQKSPRAKIYILSTMGNQVVSILHDLLKKSRDFALSVLDVEDYRVYFETEQTITTPFQDEFSECNPGTFFPNSASLEEIIDQYLREVVPLAGNCVVDLDDTFSKSEDQSCDELIYWITGEQPSSSLRSSILEKFDRLDELEEIRIEPAAKHQRIL